MFLRKPFLFVCVVWLLLPSSPALSQHHSSAANHRATAKTHKSAHQKKKAPVSTSIKVWVNTNSGVYHYPGQRWYGTTRQGEYMSEDEARKHGYRPTQNGQ